MLCTRLYTTSCTDVDLSASSLLTLTDWRAAYEHGAAPGALLTALRERLGATSPAPAWIALATTAQLKAQVQALATREATCGDRTTALHAMPLFGVPFAVKDNIDVAGWPTTAACPAYRRVAERSAQAVHNLIRAGAVCIGKTNLDQFATGLVGTRSPYGRPASAFDAGRISGGSSSGSAVVVAQGLVPFALGTDTAGSGRVPAGFNNIVGLKPTPGRVGTSGVVPACRSLDCVTVFALTVADAAQVLALIEGVDEDDEYSAYRPGRAQLPPTLRIGIPAEPQLDPALRAPWQQAIEHARALGHTLVPVDFAPLHAVADMLYNGPWLAERHAAIAEWLDRAPDALDPAVRQVVGGARRFSATDAFRSQYRLRAMQQQIASLWRSVDVLMTPTAPSHPTFAEVDADPLGVNARLGTYTNFVNLLGWCALALPAGFDAAGLPFGITFIAPGNCDAALARFGLGWAQRLQLALGATGAAPPAARETAPWPASETTLPIAVVGAHLSGLPLNPQLVERRATLLATTHTAASYRLYALPGTVPPKPGLVRTAERGAAIAVEVWDMPQSEVGAFLALVPSPLGLGSVELADGRRVHGFLCETHATVGAEDITAYGGWRDYLQQRASSPATASPRSVP